MDLKKSAKHKRAARSNRMIIINYYLKKSLNLRKHIYRIDIAIIHIVITTIVSFAEVLFFSHFIKQALQLQNFKYVLFVKILTLKDGVSIEKIKSLIVTSALHRP